MHTYSDDKDKINQNFIFYTQPIQESRFAKIEITELPDKIELSTRDANFSRILRIGAFVKDDVSELLDLRKDMMENLFKAVAGRIGCSAEDLEYLQISEIEDFLLKKESPSELIVQRRVVTVLFYPEDKLAVCAGDDAEHFIKEANMRELVETNQFTILKGQTASLGSVTGKIVVANNSGEALKKMKEGDILVAPYTAVEYVPAMQKAAAIITETGGITSHAAIVSRELKIPCIIGVKDATKVLKDGQLVEVDADNGSIELK